MAEKQSQEMVMGEKRKMKRIRMMMIMMMEWDDGGGEIDRSGDEWKKMNSPPTNHLLRDSI